MKNISTLNLVLFATCNLYFIMNYLSLTKIIFNLVNFVCLYTQDVCACYNRLKHMIISEFQSFVDLTTYKLLNKKTFYSYSAIPFKIFRLYLQLNQLYISFRIFIFYEFCSFLFPLIC